VWNSPVIPDWLVIAARVALTVCALLLFRSAGRSGLRERIGSLSAPDRQKLNRIYGRSYVLIALLFVTLGGLLVCSGLRSHLPPTSYRMTAAALVVTLLAIGGLLYRLRVAEARLFNSGAVAEVR
jgi:hypothetical protein